MSFDIAKYRRHSRSFFLRDPAVVARELIGHGIVRQLNASWVGGRIVETEAYLSESDPASHSRSGLTPRCKSMFEIGGTLYVYTIHAKYCMNVVTEIRGRGSAVLIRAIEPLWGIETMKQNRGQDDLRRLTRGPAMLCQAIGVTKVDDGVDLVSNGEIALVKLPDRKSPLIAYGLRIGISRGQEMPLRFFESGNRFVSRMTNVSRPGSDEEACVAQQSYATNRSDHKAERPRACSRRVEAS